MALMEVTDLTMIFGGIVAVDSLDFVVEEGSITALIGPNGAGKTSAFNCLTGFYKATRGEILFEGKSLLNLRPYLITYRKIIRTFQNVRLFNNLTVMDNVLSGCHRLGKKIRRQCDAPHSLRAQGGSQTERNCRKSNGLHRHSGSER